MGCRLWWLSWKMNSRHLDWGRLTPLLSIDLTAVFNMVDYDLLTHFLIVSRVCGGPLKWFSSCPLGWRERVELGEQVPSRYPLTCGVPQGEILSWMLLNIHTYSLSQVEEDLGFGRLSVCWWHTAVSVTRLLSKCHPTQFGHSLEAVGMDEKE